MSKFYYNATKLSFFANTAVLSFRQEVFMEKVLPIVIVCGVGIALCLAYILALSIKTLRARPRRKKEFEIEENVLTINLGRRKKK